MVGTVGGQRRTGNQEAAEKGTEDGGAHSHLHSLLDAITRSAALKGLLGLEECFAARMGFWPLRLQISL
jgi:hypothetical protein